MSLTAIPFAVDIENVQSVFGCKNPDLLDHFKRTRLYETYASQADDYDREEYNYDFDQVLEDIVFRYLKSGERKPESRFWGLKKSPPTSGLNKQKAHGYGYALLVICDALGTHLLPQCDGIYFGKDFEAASKTIKQAGLDTDLGDIFEQHQVFDIPEITGAPTIKLYTKEEVSAICQILNHIEIDERSLDYDSDDFDEVQEMISHIKHCFKTCYDKGSDLIFFAH